jgi:GT2 family glycosyltransferase
MNKKVAVIIVNYKDYARKFLKECRDSLRLQNYPKDLIQVYIVDNSSSDESREYLSEKYPEARIIPRNDGNYSAANNAGFRQAVLDGFEYFLVANMDVRFHRDSVSELVKAVDSDNSIGVVQSKILLYPKNKEEWKHPRINSVGNIIHYLGFGYTRGYGQVDTEINGFPEIMYASGCSYIIKKELLQIIIGYNEEYYMYHDDLELSWRAKLAGYKVVLAPKSIVYHKYEFDRSIQMVYYMERNRYLTILIYYKIPTLILIFPVLLIMDFGMFFYSIKNGWFKDLMRVYKYFYKSSTWKKIRVERKKVKKIRVRKDKDLIENYSGKILFQEINNPVLKYIANPILSVYWWVAKRLIIW